MKTRMICIAAALAASSGGSAWSQVVAAEVSPDRSTAQPAEPKKKEPSAAVADIQRALRADAEIEAAAISVAVHAETVVLSGEVDSEVQAARALSLAQQHAGGVRVSSHVEVREQAPQPADTAASALVRDVERALRQDHRTANLGVSVSIDEKQVIGLHGLVPSRESRAAAEEIAARVQGVQRVSSHLVVPGE